MDKPAPNGNGLRDYPRYHPHRAAETFLIDKPASPGQQKQLILK